MIWELAGEIEKVHLQSLQLWKDIGYQQTSFHRLYFKATRLEDLNIGSKNKTDYGISSQCKQRYFRTP